jgi:AraC-like DNA-binding protein
VGTPAAHHATTIVDATAVHSWYAEARPAPAARHLVERVWHGDPGWPRQMRLLPDGCLDIADRLSERLSRSPSEAGSLLVGAVTDRAAEHRPDPLVAEFVRRIRTGGATVDAVARAIGVSGRELRRRVRDDTALSPKQLQEVVRFRRALDGMSSLSLAATAAVAGYYDQAHLARQVRKIAGTTPSHLARSLTGGLRPACGGP